MLHKIWHRTTSRVESAWNYRMKARSSAPLLKGRGEVSEEVAAMSWRALVRLYDCYQRLLQKGKPGGKVISIARELAACIWALGAMENFKAS